MASQQPSVGENFSAFAENNEHVVDGLSEVIGCAQAENRELIRSDLQVPMRYINRPIPPILDEDKVEQFMKDIQDGDTFTPIEIMKVKGADGQTRLYSFGGCHRYEAHKRLEKDTIKAKLLETPPSVLKQYLGAGAMAM